MWTLLVWVYNYRHSVPRGFSTGRLEVPQSADGNEPSPVWQLCEHCQSRILSSPFWTVESFSYSLCLCCWDALHLVVRTHANSKQHGMGWRWSWLGSAQLLTEWAVQEMSHHFHHSFPSSDVAVRSWVMCWTAVRAVRDAQGRAVAAGPLLGSRSGETQGAEKKRVRLFQIAYPSIKTSKSPPQKHMKF